tara:strand:+ start:6708 stop:6968 length:261 start_codon:yes stop_codon:yes gene_type:complete
MGELKRQLNQIDQAIQQAHSLIENAAEEAVAAADKAAIALVMIRAGYLQQLLINWQIHTDQLFTDIDDQGATFDAWNNYDNEDQSA